VELRFRASTKPFGLPFGLSESSGPGFPFLGMKDDNGPLWTKASGSKRTVMDGSLWPVKILQVEF
jgi:hypothetical protein